MKTRTAVIFMALCLVSGFFAGVYKRPQEPETVTVVEYVVDDSPALKRMQISDALVVNLEKQQKLIVLETDLSEDITLDESFTEWNIFKKMQKITVKATGRFTVDLGGMSQNDIIFDGFSDQVIIQLPRTELDSITVNEDETVFYSVEKGALRFGEIRLTTAEQNEVYRQAKQAMTVKLQLDVMPEAEESAKASVIDLAEKFLNAAGIEKYEIVIVWK